MGHDRDFRGIRSAALLALLHILLLTLAVVLVAAPVSGFDSFQTSSQLVTQPATLRDMGSQVLPVRSLEEDSRRGFARLIDRFKQIPLRPVKIGATPRTPQDPEPGVGLVFRLRF